MKGTALMLAMLGVNAAEAASAPPAPMTAGSVLQMLAGLAVVLLAVLGTAWLARRVSPGRTAAGSSLRIVGGTSVGGRERVVVIELEDTWLVLGVAPGQVRALHTMTRPARTPPAPSSPDAPRGFAARLREMLEQRRNV